MLKKVILWHSDGLGGYNAFDVFIKKGTELNEFEREFIEGLYKIQCPFVQKFLEKYPDYEYLGSEDLYHGVYTFQAEEELHRLYKKGWKKVKACEIGLE